jgi:hypothetical protein
MRKKILFIIIILSISITISIFPVECLLQQTKSTHGSQKAETIAKNNEQDIINQLEYGKPVHITVAFNNNIYEVTDVTATLDEIGDQIGSITRQVSPRPERNGDIARNTPEGPAIVKHANGIANLYKLNGIESQKQIAVEISEGKYYQCKFLGKLK